MTDKQILEEVDKAMKLGARQVLDKIIAEIENYVCNQEENTMKAQGMLNALRIIDKYRAESEKV